MKSKTIEIPFVLSREGKVNASYYENDSGEDVTDVALLYESFDYSETVIECRARVQIPVQKLFEERALDGDLEVTRVDEGDPAEDPGAVFIVNPPGLQKKEIMEASAFRHMMDGYPPAPEVKEELESQGFSVEVKT